MKGWVPQPNQRGTIDVIWSCATTIAICCWVMIHLNIPARADSLWTLFARKSRWLLIALLAPELVMLFACGQWASAQRSVQDMHNSGYSEWTTVHGFYADMGGFMLQSPDYIEFPVNAKQVHFLVSKGYMSMPAITRREIWDKSKADKFAKAFACLQALWLVAEVVMRGFQRLAVAPLELSTVALVTCTGAAVFFWSSKPLNVETPTVVYSDVPLSKILMSAGEGAQTPFKDTPLDFIEPNLYTSSQFPFNKYWGVQERPLPRLPNDRDSHLHNLKLVLSLALPTAAFSLLHLIAWNFEFPTEAERHLWRWTCVSMGVVLGGGCLVEAGSIIFSNYTSTGLTTLRSYKLRWPHNMMFFIPGFMYFSSRLIVIVEIVISLRSLPDGCYKTVQWWQAVPHL